MALPEIKILNTLSGKKESFVPKEPGVVRYYSCGPTVYGLAHVGNAKTSISVDLINRILRYAGYKVTLARNVTDVDDKIIKLANEEGVEWNVITERFTKTYMDEMKALGNLEPEITPHATEHIPEMIAMISKLVERGAAYSAATPYGTDVYFRVDKFENSGALSKRKTDDLLVGARIEPGEMKENPLDFALWKAAKPNEPSWDSPWGKGRPGWHIECSAMVHKHFGNGLDLHAGGMDLIFPHHENEIAQAEAATGENFSKYWVHSGLLVFGKEKMSKSLGNIVTTQSFLKQFSGEVLRMVAIQQHYRSPVDFSDESLLRAEGLLERLYHCKKEALAAGSVAPATNIDGLTGLGKLIDDSLFDDFNTAKALGHILKGARTCFRENKPEVWALWREEALARMEKVFGILSKEPTQAMAGLRHQRLERMGVSDEFCREIEAELKKREAARAAKDFAESDRLRKALEDRGIQIMDGPDGAAWTMKVNV